MAGLQNSPLPVSSSFTRTHPAMENALINLTIAFPAASSNQEYEDAAPTVGPRPRPSDTTHAKGGDKIKFKKPTKRSSIEDRSGVLDASTTKKAKHSEESAATIVVGGVAKRRRRSSEGESKSKQVKNNSLLSFGNEEP